MASSGGDPSSPRPSICPSLASQDQQSAPDETDRGRCNPTLLYGGGRNVPLTLAKATVVKQIVAAADCEMARLPSVKKSGSIYASCHSQDDELNSSVEEFRSANTSMEEVDPPAGQRFRQRDSDQGDDQLLGRSRSTESDSSGE